MSVVFLSISTRQQRLLLCCCKSRGSPVQVSQIWKSLYRRTFSSAPRSHLGNGGKDRRNLVVAAFLASVAISGSLLYREWLTFKKNLGLPEGVHSIDRNNNMYIYLTDDGTPHPPQLHGKSKNPDRRVWSPWLQSHSHDPWTLLKLAQSNDRNIRLLGVKALSEEHHWNDAEFHTLAQALDHRTLIGLARTANADRRFFLPPPKLPNNEENIEDQLRRLLSALPTDDVDRCTKYFTSSALVEGKTPSEERGGLWCFGGTGIAFTESLSAAPQEVVEIFCLTALIRHSTDSLWSFDGHGLVRVLSAKVMPPDLRAEMFCLHALFTHSKLPSHCPEIVRRGGIALLRHIYELRSNSIKVKRSIARILGNIAANPNLHEEVVRGGWVTILSEWSNSADLALSLHATKTLANLDQDFGEQRKYQDGVYLYHPKHRYSEPVYADIVFVHGLLGGPFRTWRQRDPTTVDPSNKKNITPSSQAKQDSSPNGNQIVDNDEPQDDTDLPSTRVNVRNGVPLKDYTMCWPKDWLAKDCSNVRIVTVEYETHLTEWAPRCPYESEKRSLAARSDDMVRKLRQAGIGDRPIIWVGHSMGGLIIKKMLVEARSNPRLKKLVKQTKGMVFYSVPHRGSPLAAYTRQTKYLLYPSVEVKELVQDSPMLLTLHEKFQSLMFDVGIPLLSFGEADKCQLKFNMKMLVVPPESSDPGFGEYHLMENLNHLDICKPIDRDAPLYQLTLDFIRSCIPIHLVDHLIRTSRMEEFILPDMSGFR